MPMTPFASPPTPAVEDTHEPVAETHDEYEGVAAEDLPFSAGIPPEKGMIGKINTHKLTIGSLSQINCEVARDVSVHFQG